MALRHATAVIRWGCRRRWPSLRLGSGDARRLTPRRKLAMTRIFTQRDWLIPVIVACTVGSFAFARAKRADAAPLTVPYTESFATGAANWKIGPLATDVPTWVPSGGPGSAAFISRQFLVPATGSGFSGPILFRGQGIFDSSDDRFVGNWLTGGANGVPVDAFSVALRHGASAPVLFELRFAPEANSPGASTQRYTVVPGEWTTLTVPIRDSSDVFQSYSGVTPPDETAFNSIFSDLWNIQVGLAPVGVQDASVRGGTWTFDLAAPSIAAVPEPGAWASLAAAAAVAAAIRTCRLRGRHAR
jgi:hypothetical protein